MITYKFTNFVSLKMEEGNISRESSFEVSILQSATREGGEVNETPQADSVQNSPFQRSLYENGSDVKQIKLIRTGSFYATARTHNVCKFTRVERAARSPFTLFHGPHFSQFLSLPISKTFSEVSLPNAIGISPLSPTCVKFLGGNRNATIFVRSSA